MRDASEYDLYLPLRYNDGRPIEPDIIAQIKEELHEQFGGLTFFPQQIEGIWRFGAVTFHEEIVIVRVLAEESRVARNRFLELKDHLKRRLGQEEVLIVERKVEIL